MSDPTTDPAKGTLEYALQRILASGTNPPPDGMAWDTPGLTIPAAKQAVNGPFVNRRGQTVSPELRQQRRANHGRRFTADWSGVPGPKPMPGGDQYGSPPGKPIVGYPPPQQLPQPSEVQRLIAQLVAQQQPMVGGLR